MGCLTSSLAACATFFSPCVYNTIIQVESSDYPWALHVNPPRNLSVYPKTRRQATRIATYWINKGYTVDIGLMQVNSRNLAQKHVSVWKAFDPCTNLHLGGEILKHNYDYAQSKGYEDRDAVFAALSLYNTGTLEGGMRNGYLRRYRHMR